MTSDAHVTCIHSFIHSLTDLLEFMIYVTNKAVTAEDKSHDRDVYVMQ